MLFIRADFCLHFSFIKSTNHFSFFRYRMVVLLLIVPRFLHTYHWVFLKQRLYPWWSLIKIVRVSVEYVIVREDWIDVFQFVDASICPCVRHTCSISILTIFSRFGCQTPFSVTKRLVDSTRFFNQTYTSGM